MRDNTAKGGHRTALGLLTIAAIASVSVGAYGILRDRGAQTIRPEDKGQTEEACPASSPQVVVHEHRYLDTQPSSVASASAQRQPGTVEVTDDPAYGEAPAFDQGTIEEFGERLQKTFESEGPPTSAARQLEGDIRTRIARPEAKGAQMRRIDCRGQHCRAEFEFDSIDTNRRVMMGLFPPDYQPPMPFNFSAVKNVVDAQGRVFSVVHFYPEPTDS